jgi:hypothetical protein
MERMRRSFWRTGSALALLAACGSDASTATSSQLSLPTLASITVTLASSSLTVGQTTQASVSLLDASGNGFTLRGDTIVWSSSASAVASVSGAGLVTAGAPGTATITASASGKSGSAAVTVLAPTPSEAGCGTVNAGATLTSLSRDGGSTAGGVKVLLTGTGFRATDCVKFGGVAATNVTLLNPTTLQATAPPRAIGAVDITVTQSDAVSTLPAAFTYWPEPTKILASADFENGTLGSFTTFSPKNNLVVTTKAHSGTHSLYSFADFPSTTNQISWVAKQNDIVGGPGRWHRWYMLIPAPTLANTAKNGQIKLFLSRTGVSNNFTVLGEGLEFNSTDNSLAGRMDQNNIHINTGPVITPDVWHEVQVYEFRDPNTHQGTTRIWWDGKLVGQATSPLLGDDDPALGRGAAFGAVYTQNAAGYPIEVYVDDIVIADGYINPVP